MATRSRVLEALRSLHRAKREVFEGDQHALKVVTGKIREEFRKNVQLTDPSKIEEAIVLASDSAKYLRSAVVQLRQKSKDTFELRLTKNTATRENVMYDPDKEIPFEVTDHGCCQQAKPRPP